MDAGSQVTVVFRMPGTLKPEVFIEGNGNKQFIISPFIKTANAIHARGEIRQIEFSDLKQVFDNFDLKKAERKYSVDGSVYTDSVRKAVREIENGKYSKVVLTACRYQEAEYSVYDLFVSLCKYNPDAFVYAFNAGNKVMIGATPERLLLRKGPEMFTEALGGTRTHGVFSEKELIEHEHICTYIEEILRENQYEFKRKTAFVKRAGDLEHLSTGFEIESQLPLKDSELCSKLHPTPAVCGLPYKPALEFILQNESYDRSYYCGFLGPLRPDGDFSFFVNLRCAECYDDGLLLFAGAGINALSVPEDEWEEVINKMETVARWLK